MSSSHKHARHAQQQQQQQTYDRLDMNREKSSTSASKWSSSFAMWNGQQIAICIVTLLLVGGIALGIALPLALGGGSGTVNTALIKGDPTTANAILMEFVMTGINDFYEALNFSSGLETDLVNVLYPYMNVTNTTLQPYILVLPQAINANRCDINLILSTGVSVSSNVTAAQGLTYLYTVMLNSTINTTNLINSATIPMQIATLEYLDIP